MWTGRVIVLMNTRVVGREARRHIKPLEREGGEY